MKITTVFSPGRVNIIGEHTDHQMGLVLPVCIDKGVTLYGKIIGDEICVYSALYDETDRFSLSNMPKTNSWRDYVRGTIIEFYRLTNIIPSVKIFISSDLPSNQGLSSSAAIEVGIFYLLQTLYDTHINKLEMIKACWKAENEFVGVMCGMMDQTVISMTEENGLMIDFNNMDFTQFKVPEKISFYLIDTKVKRKLSESQYNSRINTLSSAINKLQREKFNDISNLSELDVDSLDDIRKIIKNEDNFNLIKHVLKENQRVVDYYNLAMKNKWSEAGTLLYQSHESLKRDFKVSWSKADEIINYCKSVPQIHGARMVGGGWGGNVLIQLMEKDVSRVIKKLDYFFMRKYSESLKLIEISLSMGVRQISDEISEDVKRFFDDDNCETGH